MKEHSKMLAYCAVVTALGTVLMMILGLTGIGTYAAPLWATLLLVPVQEQYGTRMTLTVWLATGILALLLVTDRELAIVYFTIFGWYPALRPRLERLPFVCSMVIKAAAFNGAVILSYGAMLFVLGIGEDTGGPVLAGSMLLLGNIVFVLEDRFLIPKAALFLKKRLRRL